MNYPPPGSKFPYQGFSQETLLPSPNRVHAAAEDTSLTNSTQWVPNPSYDHGNYPPVSVVQAYTSTTAFYSNGYIDSQMALPLESTLDDTVAQSHQLSNSTTGPNVQSMAPPPNPRKRKAPTLRLEDWEPVKARLIELHIHQKRPLPEVKQIVEEEFKPISFTATIRQYRARLSQWDVDKNVKPHEMRAIVRKRQHRRVRETSKGELKFRVRGSEVPPEKIDRWMKRHTEEILSPLSQAAATPGALSAWTASEQGSPAPSPAASITSIAISPFPSFAQSPGVASPASSLSSVILRSSRFAGQSPALRHRDLAVLQAPDAQLWSAGDQATASTPYRYREADEDHTTLELSLYAAQWGDRHTETLRELKELGENLLDQGRYRSAEETFRKLAADCRAEYGKDHIKTLAAFDGLGRVFMHQGLYDEAEKLHQKTFEARKRVLGAEHPETLASMANLASTYSNQGRWKEAEELEVQVMETFKRVLGAEHPSTLTSMANLASTYRNQGRWKEAKELQAEELKICERVLGAEHPSTLTSMGNLASTYRNQGRWKEAEELEVQVMETRKRVLGAEHPSTLASIGNLASTYRN